MKYASYECEHGAGWGVLDGDRIIDLAARAGSLRSALEDGSLPLAMAELEGAAPVLDLATVSLRSPLPDTGRIFCVGLNYVAHREETGRHPTEHPVMFVRFAGSVVGHGQAMILPRESTQFDFEGELAVVIGSGGRRITRDGALRHVAGYACFNDGSLRDWQSHTHQYTPGKNFDCSGAFGPWLVSADEVGDPNAALHLQTRLNGTVVQDTHTDHMIFSVPVIIEYLSSFTTLQPGDVIATGTPGGVGFKRAPPLFMQAGDVVEVEIERVGLLRNIIEPG